MVYDERKINKVVKHISQRVPKEMNSWYKFFSGLEIVFF